VNFAGYKVMPTKFVWAPMPEMKLWPPWMLVVGQRDERAADEFVQRMIRVRFLPVLRFSLGALCSVRARACVSVVYFGA
jgi:hypothetical protein